MSKLFDSDNKYKLALILILTFVLIFIVISVILSNYKAPVATGSNVGVVLSDGDLAINYINGQEISFYDKKEHSYEISLTNNSTSSIYYSIYLEDYSTTKINISIQDEEGNTINEITDAEAKILNLYSIEPEATVRYNITFSQTKLSNFKGSLKVVNESLTTQLFSDLILLNNTVETSKTRIGSQIATANEGLQSTQDDLGTTYFFRGNIQNNYVKLGDLMFRIVRINGDETVRLVLDDVLDTTFAYNTNQSSTKVGNLAILSTSSSNALLNNWLNTNLSNYLNYIVEGTYCTDTTFPNTINGINYSSAYERAFVDDAPDLTCNGTKYQSKVGYLSVDEVILAGASETAANVKYYLYNENIKGSYLTLSTYSLTSSNIISMINIMSDGSIGTGTRIDTESYIRPVINIDVNAKVKGEGTKDNPYIIVS